MVPGHHRQIGPRQQFGRGKMDGVERTKAKTGSHDGCSPHQEIVYFDDRDELPVGTEPSSTRSGCLTPLSMIARYTSMKPIREQAITSAMRRC